MISYAFIYLMAHLVEFNLPKLIVRGNLKLQALGVVLCLFKWSFSVFLVVYISTLIHFLE